MSAEDSGVGGATPERRTSRTYEELVEERSLSPDLVSLSSTSDNEQLHSQSDTEESQQHQVPTRGGSSPVEGDQRSSNASQSVDSDSPTDHVGVASNIPPADGHGHGRPSLSVAGPRVSPSPQHVSSQDSEGSSDSPLTGSLRYQLLDKSKLTVSDFESTGLLYARASQQKHNIDLMSPADEVAVEVCDAEEVEQDKANLHIRPAQVHRVKDVVVEPPTLETSERWVAPIDPGALLEMEKSARHVATEMLHVMDNLRNSLFAMTICTKQSIQLHRESVDNLHAVVDANVKGMYTFMTKFEELHKSLTPMKQLANQIREMDENLKVLERAFTKTKQ